MSQPPARIDPGAAGGPTGEAPVIVDARGHRCPVPTLRLRRALAAAAPEASVVLLADDPLARIDVPHFLAREGYAPPVIAEAGGDLRFTVRNRSHGSCFGKTFSDIP